MEWYLKVLKEHYADFKGRARRKEYWMFTLFNTLILVGLILICIPFVDLENENDFPIIFILPLLYGLAIIIPTIAVEIRRLHDTGKSGWFWLIRFIPFGGFVILIFTVMDSDVGPNKWGDNPKGIGNDRELDQIGKE